MILQLVIIGYGIGIIVVVCGDLTTYVYMVIVLDFVIVVICVYIVISRVNSCKSKLDINRVNSC